MYHLEDLRSAPVRVLMGMLFILVCVPYASAQQGASNVTISVSGNRFFKNGKPWISGGVNLRPLERAQPSRVAPGAQRAFNEAAQHYNARELKAIRAYGANTVRFQISEPGLDPRSPEYVPGYLHHIVAVVRQAQNAGFAVVLAMQWEKGATGVSGLPHMPGAATLRAWSRLAPIFGHDGDVLYELFNEPNIRKNPAKRLTLKEKWSKWKSAFQPLIDRIRNLGARNVLIVDGLLYAHTLQGAPTLTDPLMQLAYGVHPYITHGEPTSAAGWNTWFGNFADHHPVIITEWFIASRNAHFCRPQAPRITHTLLTYALHKRMGFIMAAFDVPGILVKNYHYTLTTLKDFHCGRQYDGGPGKAFQRLFLKHINQHEHP